MKERDLQTPYILIHLDRLRRNADLLDDIRLRTGVRVLLALKGFAAFSTFPAIRDRLDGVCSSSPWEARLGREEFGGEVHAFAPAYSGPDIAELTRWADTIVFNSIAQWNTYRPVVHRANRPIACGLRINPECSTGAHALYDPCAPQSRLGIRRGQLEHADLDGISGLHFHTLCEQDADALEKTWNAVEQGFGDRLPAMNWLNLGGGHLVTRPGYDIDRLCAVIERARRACGGTVYIEPGEAVALHCGELVGSVLDIVHNEIDIAILDTSAATHMPDILEMPYRPDITGAGRPGEKPHTYRLGGRSCLAGDVIGDYSFDTPLKPGDRLVFNDMAHYTMVKSTMFNGLQPPSIVLADEDDGDVRIVREFTYEDYKGRLS